MEILDTILLIWAGIIIIFQFVFINYLQNQNEDCLKIAKENKEMYITLIEAYKLKLECYENKNK
ncbi:hypothetical protein BKN14_00350 [Candidatus Gracilibacteria bacterium HOT-871]|nr:hypothetical protein BKN14_00350 [Candidatus Gracilibacteria bacterium HOT-871]